MRIVYFGTPLGAVAPLEALVAAGHEVALVVTQPDRRRGRGVAMIPSPVRRAAEALGLDVLTPLRAIETLDALRATGAELGVVVAFGQLLAVELLESLPLGFVNLHFSLLPRWRGAAPVERAILAGDTETGVGLMAMEAGLDTGPIYAEERVPIDPLESAGALHDRLVEVGTRLLIDQLPGLASATSRPQVGEPTYAHKLTVAEFRLDPILGAEELACVIRAGNPRPGAWCLVDGRRVKILQAASCAASDDEAPGTLRPGGVLVCGSGALSLEMVQPEGKQAMSGAAWCAGLRVRTIDPL